jgi:hypothetical protein
MKKNQQMYFSKNHAKKSLISIKIGLYTTSEKYFFILIFL